MEQRDQMFFALLRSAMMGGGFEATPTADDWATLYQTARKQSLVGVVYTAVAVTLPERIRRRSWSLAEANKRDGIG